MYSEESILFFKIDFKIPEHRDLSSTMMSGAI